MHWCPSPPPPPWSALFSAAGTRLAVGARILGPLWSAFRTTHGAALRAAEEGLAPGIIGGPALCWVPGGVLPSPLGVLLLSPSACLPPPAWRTPCCYGERLWTAGGSDGGQMGTSDSPWHWVPLWRKVYTFVEAGAPACPLLPMTFGSPGWKGLQRSRAQCRRVQEGGCHHGQSGTPCWAAAQTLCSLPAALDGAWQIHYTDEVATRGPDFIAVILEARWGPRASGTPRLGRHM
ncbi:hypothetical protein NDU88_002532 [Pleurodeles waltl]|uniref:Uncharacterized protein n=1 Tax=Pleurodeles waltl TaxID=8319 RepID=A0AAV7VAT0_PLEWA|nr:hypothetical protein NDU88_002532 [Pleurodeles waltl]